MTLHEQILVNDTFVRKDEPLFEQLSFILNDPVIIREPIRCIASNLLFFKYHYRSILNHLNQYSVVLPEWMSETGLKNNLTRLLTRNRIFGGALLSIQLFITTDGLNHLSMLASVSPVENKQPTLNEKGLTACLFNKHSVQPFPTANFSQTHATIRQQAHSGRLSQSCDVVFLVNQNAKLIGTDTTPVFLIKDQLLYTPPVSTGVPPHTYRDLLLHSAKRHCKKIITDQMLHPEHLNEADELFIADTIDGLRWIVSYNDSRYFCRLIKKIHATIKEWAENDINSNSDLTES